MPFLWTPGSGEGGGGDGYSPIIPYQSGLYYDQQFWMAHSSNNVAGVAGHFELYPLPVHSTVTISELAAQVSTAGAASTEIKLVLYTSHATTGWPDVLLHETAGLDVSTTGLKTASYSTTLTGGTVYWIGIRHSGTASLYAHTTNRNIGGALGQHSMSHIRRTGVTFADPAPNPFVAVEADLNNNRSSIKIAFRVA